MAVALPLFAITLFVSAFLLFLVQPMISNIVLPYLGGTPQVWNTCVVFFQSALLLGYAYSHTVSTRLKLRMQVLVHGVFLLLPLAVLFSGSFRDNVQAWYTNNIQAGGNPIPSTLLLLTVVVGLPFLVVSTTAPLLQRWFAYTGHPSAKDPYFLYGASNLGSMLSLLIYPFFYEPAFGLQEQSWLWTYGYVGLLVLYFACVALVLKAPEGMQLPGEGGEEAPKAEAPRPETAVTAKPAQQPLRTGIKKGPKIRGGRPLGGTTSTPARVTTAAPSVAYHEIRSDEITVWRRLRWVALAAVPSSLMLGVTTYMSTDVSAIPLFWVLPLALYLLSFILVFSRWPLVWVGPPHTLMVIAQPLVVIFLIFILLTGQVSPIWRSIGFSVMGFFLTAMVCHGELARDRPPAKSLTEFYLWMSVGGMLGGVFNGIVAPVVFWGVAELPIALTLSFVLRPFTGRLAPVEKPLLMLFGGLLGLGVGLTYFYGYYLLTGSLNYFLLGTLICLVGGVVYGAAFTFDRQTAGFTDTLLVNAFPDMARWFDQKGKELRQEAGETPAEEAPRRLGRAAPADYYVLNYALDIVLPLLVAVVTILLTLNADAVFRNAIKVGQYTFGMSQTNAVNFARSLTMMFQYGLPALCALAFSFRPWRFGLCIGVLFLAAGINEATRERGEVLARTRSYFGVLRVLQEAGDPISAQEAAILNEQVRAQEEARATLGEKEDPNLAPVKAGETPPYTYLMHGTTHHGLNYQWPQGLRRLATTYYHRKNPAGVVMERFNWFPDPTSNITFWSDVRFPAAVAALGHAPLPGLVNLWSEPPYATIGLGTGTMASYARPFHHMTFYEIDETIRNFSLGEHDLSPLAKYGLPEGLRGPFYNYLHDALARGANLEVVMGDARQSMRDKIEEIREQERQDRGYGGNYQRREKYYHALVVDAFSSDAIPRHLVTKEAIQQYFEHMAEEGIVCMHTSNRHLDLVEPIVDIAAELKLAYIVGNDAGEKGQALNAAGQVVNVGTGERGHFQCEYVLLARKPEYFTDSRVPIRATSREEMAREEGPPALRWTVPAPDRNRRVWTDDYVNMLSVFRWGFR